MSTILILDDDCEFRELISLGLAERGHLMLEAATGEEAGRLIDEHAIDLVVVDGLLPDTDGFSWITQFRLNKKQCKIVYVSRLWQDESSFGHRLLADDLKVSLILHKPIVPMTFFDQIDAVLSGGESVPALQTVPKQLSVQDKIGDLTARYVLKLPAKLSELKLAIDKVRCADSHEASALVGQVILLAHKLRGTAPSFGFSALGRVAGEIEDLARAISIQPDGEDLWTRIDREFSKAQEAMEREPERVNKQPRPTEEAERTSVVIFSDILDLVNASRYKVTLAGVGRQSFDEKPFDAIVIDLNILNMEEALSITKELRRACGFTVPLGLIGAAPIEKEKSVFLGVSKVIDKQKVSATEIECFTEQLLAMKPGGLPRILILDDDESFCSYVSQVLTAEGMIVESQTEEGDFFRVIGQFKPDLVLVDVVLPAVSGFDVCRRLRMIPEWRELPVLFLTSKSELDSRLAAFQAGGDEYVLKPVVTQVLLSRIRAVLRKEELIRQRWQIDPFTGVSTRQFFLEDVGLLIKTRELEEELPSSLCLIDIDNLSDINERFGRESGDKFIVRLGQLLSDRFRVEDRRGRWGDGEFVLLLRGLAGREARAAIELLRQEFQLRSRECSSDDALSGTFSTGIACYPEESRDLDSLLILADARLRDAKERGDGAIVDAEVKPSSSQRKRSKT